MTVDEIFSKLSAHMIKGLMIHDQIATIYGFLNLCGYQKCHEYHYYDESRNYRHIQDYYLEHYGKLLAEEPIENPNLIPQTWLKYSKEEVDSNTKRTTVRDMMRKWIEWETETRINLQLFYKELYEMGEVSTAWKLGELLKDVEHELKRAKEKKINLESIDYNMSSIIGEQKMLYHKYKDKIEEKCRVEK